MKFKNQKGFTLIELLVVIAVIGVMMGAVIVAINPAKRLADARDADGKGRVASVASAMEACFTKNEGKYTGGSHECDTVGDLVTNGYLKLDPGDVIPFGCDADKCCLYYDLENSTDDWVYESKYGKAQERTGHATCP